MDGLSAHADQGELLKWMGGFKRPPRQTYVVHGEPASAEALATAIRAQLKWKVDVAQDGLTISLDGRDTNRATTKLGPPAGRK